MKEQSTQIKQVPFPVSSYKGNTVMFVAYDYRSNGIFIRPMKSNSNESMIAAFTDVYDSLTSKGLKPKLNVMDNACSKAVEAYIRSTGADIQLVNADDHRVNASERAIQTWKNHWAEGMRTVDENCPMQLWDEWVEQGQDTLNLLRASRVNPKLSAYALLNGPYNFNKVPLAPVETKSLVFIDPSNRKTFEQHALDAWYLGPAKKHYRNYRFFLPKTRGIRTASTAKFFPQHCKMPAIEPADTIRLAAQDLIQAMKNQNKNAPIHLHEKHTAALRQLSEILQASDPNKADEDIPEPLPRVNAPSTSNDTSEAIRVQPRIHQRHTRSNVPMPTVLEEEFEDEIDIEKENEPPRVKTAPRVKDPVVPTHSPPRVRKPLQPVPVSPNMPRTRRTIAQYKKQMDALKKSTPNKNIPVPITPEKASRQSPRWLPHMATVTTPCGISSKAV
eukprot:scaffold40896_cov41-Cyclotella_meneghiniana.AAC.1